MRHLTMTADSSCDMACFRPQNRPYRLMKRPVLQGKTAHVAKCLNTNDLWCRYKETREAFFIAKYFYKLHCGKAMGTHGVVAACGNKMQHLCHVRFVPFHTARNAVQPMFHPCR